MDWCVDSDSSSDDNSSEFEGKGSRSIEDESGGDLASWLKEVLGRDCFLALTHVAIEVYAPAMSLEEEVPHDSTTATKHFKRDFQAWDGRGILSVNIVLSKSTTILGSMGTWRRTREYKGGEAR